MRRIFWQIPDLTACGYYRVYLPYMHCHEQLKQEGIELVMSDRLDTGESFDVYCFNRICTLKFFPYVQRFKKEGKKIVWGTDDLLTDVPPWNPAGSLLTGISLRLFQECLALADTILVSTEALKRELGFADKTTVAPNLIDLSAWPKQEIRPPGPIRILWAGGISHSEDLDLIVDDLKRIIRDYGDKVRVMFYGLAPARMHPHPQVEIVPGTVYQDYIPTMTRLRPDIGLCPLADHRFNRCKSNVKWLEYTAAGATTLAQRLDPYLNSTLVTCEDWYHPLRSLIEHPWMREADLACSRLAVVNLWSWESEGRAIWLDLFRSL